MTDVPAAAAATGDGVEQRRLPVPSARQLAAGATPPAAPSGAARGAGVTAHPEERESPLRVFLGDMGRGFTFSWLRSGVDPRPFLKLTALAMSAGLVTAVFSVVISPVQHDLNVAPYLFATILMVGQGLSYVLGPLICYQADRRGDRLPRAKLMGIAGLVGALGGITSGLARNALHLFGARSLANAGAGLAGAYSPVKPGLLVDSYRPEVRGEMFGSAGALDNLAGVLAPIIGAVIAVTVGWRAALVITGIPLALSAVWVFAMREPVRGAIDREALGMSHEQATIAPEPPRLGEMLRILASVKTLRRFWYAQPFLLISGEGIGILIYIYLLSGLHADPVLIAVMNVVTFVFVVAAQLYGGAVTRRLIADRPGRALVFSAAMGAAGIIGYVGLSLNSFLPLTFVMFALIAFTGSFFGPAQATVLALVMPSRVRTFGFSTMGTLQLIGYPFLAIFYALGQSLGFRGALLLLIPLNLIGALIFASCGSFVAADIRAGQAATLAEEAARSSREKLLICRDVDVTYPGGVQVLFNVDLDVERGEIVALLGTNGAGKSTLLRAISGLTEASNGAIFFDGRDITHLPTPMVARQGVVQVLGGRAIFPRLTVQENLEAATWLSDDDEFIATQRRRILDELFPVLKTRLRERAGTLSGGEQQMLALSQAFLMKPTLLMIDELSLGLSPAVVEQLLAIVRAIHESGTTIILVEQSVNVALTVAQRAVFMEKGEVRFDGSTAELLARPDLLRSVFFASAASAATSSFASGGVAAQPQTSRITVLEADGISCRFGGVQALRDAHLILQAGEIVGVIGPNGAGKSTLFDAISGYAPMQAGRVLLQGRDVTRMSPDARARLGLVRSFQDAKLFPSLTVADNLAVALERFGVVRSAAFAALWLPAVRQSEARIHRRVEELIELLGIGEFRDRLAGELSTGTRRVVDLACMMAADPEVLLLDEPTAGIAQAEVQSFAPLLERIRRETGCAIAIVEHDMTLITAVSDRIVAMELGSVVVEGSAATVLNDPRVVAAYLGTSQEAIARSGAVPV